MGLGKRYHKVAVDTDTKNCQSQGLSNLLLFSSLSVQEKDYFKFSYHLTRFTQNKNIIVFSLCGSFTLLREISAYRKGWAFILFHEFQSVVGWLWCFWTCHKVEHHSVGNIGQEAWLGRKTGESFRFPSGSRYLSHSQALMNPVSFHYIFPASEGLHHFQTVPPAVCTRPWTHKPFGNNNMKTTTIFLLKYD